MQFARVNGLALGYQMDGLRDGPTLVFVNSLGSDYRIWDEVMPHLAGSYRLLRFDLRGHGLTDCPAAPYRIEDLSGDLIGLLDALSIAKAVVVGISVGGLIAQHAAIAHPDRVERLILCDTSARLGEPDLWQTRIDGLKERGLTGMAAEILPRWFAESFPADRPADYAGYLNMLSRMPLEGYIGTCTALRDTDLREAVGRITAPTLVVCGADDLATPPDVVRQLADSIPGAQFALIEGAGHLPCLENPTQFSHTLMEFLA